jgi:hypothetical protein
LLQFGRFHFNRKRNIHVEAKIPSPINPEICSIKVRYSIGPASQLSGHRAKLAIKASNGEPQGPTDAVQRQDTFDSSGTSPRN